MAEEQENATGKPAEEEKPKRRARRKPPAEDAPAEAQAPEEKPKRRTRRKPPAEGAPAEEKPKRRRRAPAEQAPAADEEPAAATEPEADEAGEPEEQAAAPTAGGRRRGAEASAGTTPAPAPRRSPDGPVAVRAKARYVRCAPRKARLVVEHIRGKPVDEARAILVHTPRAASRDVLKLLNSAIANAENNHELVADELKVGHVYVDEGPTLKRYRPRALGRATRIRKRTSHLIIELTAKE